MKILYFFRKDFNLFSKMIDEACCFPDLNVIRKIEVEGANGILTSLLGNLMREVKDIRILQGLQ